MKKHYKIPLASAVLAAAVLITAHRAQAQFTAGDIVVERIGDGSATLTSAATAVFVDEYAPVTASQANPAYTVALPSSATQPSPSAASPAANTTNLNLTDSGTAASDGFLSRSADGSTLVVSGYNAALGLASVAKTASSSNQRIVGTVSATGAVNTTTYSATADSGTSGNIRSVASVNGTSFYTSGAGTAGGTNYFASRGGSTSTNIVTTPSITNTRVNEIFTTGGTQSLFYSTGSGTTGIYSLGGLPTTATGTTATLLVADASPYGFSIASTGKTIYVADDGLGIEKFTSATGAAGSFTLAATFATKSEGLAVNYGTANPTIYATSSDGTTLFSITDDGSNADFASQTANVLATASTNETFRGVDFAPTAVPEPTTWLAGALSVLTLAWAVARRGLGLFGVRGV